MTQSVSEIATPSAARARDEGIPFVDLMAQHQELRSDLSRLFEECVDNSDFIGGRRVAEFEIEFAKFIGVNHAVSVSNGTDAIAIALKALGVGRGDIVITVSYTFIGTAEGILIAGAEPRFIDVNPDTYDMNADLLENYLDAQCRRGPGGELREIKTGARVAAILPVHLYGLPADMDALLDVAEAFELPLIEDACQAHGARVQTRGRAPQRAGAVGTAGCFSFYPSKNLGAMGDAGAITTNDSQLAERMQLLREHGQSHRYVHLRRDGTNARMDALQAGILQLKLSRLDEWNDMRTDVARWYRESLGSLEHVQLPVDSGRHHVYHLYVVRVQERDRIRQELSSRGVGTGIHYPMPIHLQPAFEGLHCSIGPLQEAERAAAEVLSLPMFPHLTKPDVATVAERLAEVVG